MVIHCQVNYDTVILTEGKDLVASIRIEILPSFVGQDDTSIKTCLTV
jgi:hypothetical protein